MWHVTPLQYTDAPMCSLVCNKIKKRTWSITGVHLEHLDSLNCLGGHLNRTHRCAFGVHLDAQKNYRFLYNLSGMHQMDLTSILRNKSTPNQLSHIHSASYPHLKPCIFSDNAPGAHHMDIKISTSKHI